MLDVRVEVRPRWAFRLPRRGSSDGVLRCRDGVLSRLVHVEDEPVVVRVAQLAPDRVLFGAQGGARDACEEAIARMRFALAVDDDLRPFHERFRFDPLIGVAVRRHPHLRVERRPEPFEALAAAVCEQLIDTQRAFAIERRMVHALGRRCPRTGLRDAPAASAVAGVAPALLESFDLAAGRAIALVRAAREVASGRVDLRAEHEHGWRRLLAIRGIGPWTVEVLALHGQGRYDQVPAGDLNFLKLLGRARSGGDPAARATVEEVRELFEPYGAWRGLAAAFALRGGITGLHPAGTRSSGPSVRLAA